VISSGTNVSSEQDLAVNLNGLNNKVAFGRALQLGRISRALHNYRNNDTLTAIDKRLLKGFYTSDRWVLVNSSEDEAVKFNYKLDHNRIKGILKRTAARREDKFTVDLALGGKSMTIGKVGAAGNQTAHYNDKNSDYNK
jgi:hypothetical protein